MADDENSLSGSGTHAPGSDTPNQSTGTTAEQSNGDPSRSTSDTAAPVVASPAPSTATSGGNIAAGIQSTPVDGPPRINAGATGRADPNDYGEAGAPSDPSPNSEAYHQRSK